MSGRMEDSKHLKLSLNSKEAYLGSSKHCDFRVLASYEAETGHLICCVAASG